VPNSKLALFDVDDGEAFVERVARNWCRRTRSDLTAADREDMHAYLLAELWRVGERFSPTEPTASFRSYAYSILSFRCTDWLRQAPSGSGRTRWAWSTHTYERPVVHTLSLDAPLLGDDPAADHHSLAERVASDGGDPQVARLADERERFDAAALRDESRNFAVLRAEFARRSTGRTRSRRADR
jgi:DNA-directed RNA polymerase specialized sigma24 family protein